jgi:hypothetical protein
LSVTLQTGPNRLDFLVRGERFATYRYGETRSPGFTALFAPGERAISSPGEALWLAHGNVQGVAFRASSASDAPQEGTDSQVGQIISTEMLARRGRLSVGFRQTCDWITPGGQCLLTDTRTVRAGPGPGEGRILDMALRLTAPDDSPVTLGRTPEALLILRVASALCPAGGGQLRNSVGDYGPAAMQGRSAAWCAGVGVVQGATVGFALLDHPDNPWHPSPWHVQEDGTLSPSPFAWRAVELPAGGALLLRYRLHVYSGYVDAGWADARLAEFAHSPNL